MIDHAYTWGLVPVHAGVASLLLPSCHGNQLYCVGVIAVILNITADVADGSRVDAILLLCAFANKAVNSFALEYISYVSILDTATKRIQ